MIDLAIEVAVKAHQDQVRKGTETPYIVHPPAVGIILAKAGCSDEVITGEAYQILHRRFAREVDKVFGNRKQG